MGSGAEDEVRDSLVERSFPGARAIRGLTPEEGQTVARTLFDEGRGVKELDHALRKHGLVAGISRACGYAPIGRARGLPKAVAVIPYTASDPEQRIVGALGLSHGEPGSGVIAKIEENKVVGFHTLDWVGGEVLETEVPAKKLVSSGPESFVRGFAKGVPREEIEPDMTVEMSAAVAAESYRVLLFDQHSTMIHSERDLNELVHNMPLVTAMAELQYMRLHGLAASPGDACCCCCTCSWGSCSSCCAVATHYVNPDYYAHAT